MLMAHLAATGALDRIAALVAAGHRARPDPGRHAWRAGRRTRHHRRDRPVGPAGLPRRRRAGRGVRVAAPAATWCGTTGSTTTCWASRRRRSTSCPGTPTSTRMPARLHRDFIDIARDNQLAHPGAATMCGSPVDLVPRRPRRLRRRRRRRSPCPWQNCYQTTQLLGGEHQVRALHQRAHRRDHQPTRQQEGQLPHRRATTRPTPRAWLASAEEQPGSWWQDYTPGWPSTAATSERRRRNRAGPTIPSSPMRRAPTCWSAETDERRRTIVAADIGEALGTDYFSLREPVHRRAGGLLAPDPRLRRRRGAAGRSTATGSAPSSPGRWSRRWPRPASSATASRATAARRSTRCPPGWSPWSSPAATAASATFVGVQAGLAMRSIAMLRLRGAEAALAAADGPAGEDRRVRADRARPRLRLDRAGDHRPPRRRQLGARRAQEVDRQRHASPTSSSCGPATPTDEQVKGFLVEKGTAGLRRHG